MKQQLRNAFSILRVAIAVAIVVYLARSGVITWTALRRLRDAWPLTIAATVLTALCMLVTAWRLCVLVRPRGLELSLLGSTRLTLIGIFFSMTLPGSTGGDAVRIYYAAAGNPGRRMEVATLLLLDRAAGMFGLLLWPLFAALFFPTVVASSRILSGLLLFGAMVALAMLIAFTALLTPSIRYHRLTQALLSRAPLGKHVQSMIDTLHAYRHHRSTLLGVVGITLLAHTLAIAVAMIVATAVNPAGAAPVMCLLIPLGLMANTLPATPGGLGVGEAAFEKLFALAGLSGGAQVMFGWRLFLALAGLIGLLAYIQGSNRVVRTAEKAPTDAAESEPVLIAAEINASGGR